MTKYPEDYVKYVLNDIEENKGKRRIVRASHIERLFVRKVSPLKMHPNPEDEFSMPEIGPNFQIIANYSKQVRNMLLHSDIIFEDPIILEKIKPGGYLILNGHHRWFAARRMGVKKVFVNVINLTHVEDIIEALNRTNNVKRVVFDLDEVLLAGVNGSKEEQMTAWIGTHRINERLRTGTVKLLKKLQEKEFDVWVYTKNYRTKEYIHSIFHLYGLSICGCVNATWRINNTNEYKNRMKELFEHRYKTTVNIDNESVLVVRVADNDYEQYALKYDNPDAWVDSVISVFEANQL